MELELLKLRAENASLKTIVDAKDKRTFTVRMTDKGGVSVYGTGRFPTTHYPAGWEFILDNADKIKAFIALNKEVLDSRGLASKEAKAQAKIAKG